MSRNEGSLSDSNSPYGRESGSKVPLINISFQEKQRVDVFCYRALLMCYFGDVNEFK